MIPLGQKQLASRIEIENISKLNWKCLNIAWKLVYIKWPKYPSTTTFCPMKDTDNHDTPSAELRRSPSENLLAP